MASSSSTSEHAMLTRRESLKLAMAAPTGATLVPKSSMPTDSQSVDFRIIDTNVSLFQWPFQRLPLDTIPALVQKLRSLAVTQAWAGNFEGLLHRDTTSVNNRLAAACQEYDELIPIGSINPTLPGWHQDLERCVQHHKMPGVRLHPNYHGYSLSDKPFAELLQRSLSCGCFVQVAVSMEDNRTQSSLVQAADVDLVPLGKVLARIPSARVQLLNARLRPAELNQVRHLPNVVVDTARVDGTDAVPQLVRSVGKGRVLFGSHTPFLIPEAAMVRVHESQQLNSASLASVLLQQRPSFCGSRERLMTAALPGLPSTASLKRYRIWDSYFTPAFSHPGRNDSDLLFREIERSLPAIQSGQFEKLCYFPHVGLGTTTDRDFEETVRSRPETVLAPFERWPDLLIGMIQVNANNVAASLEALDHWIQNGPMKGVYFPGGGPAALTCNHPSFDPLVERIQHLGGVIMQHTWFKTGGKQNSGESTPSELAELAARHPNQTFIAAHAGGEWEQGLRAVRDSPNVLVETSGFDAKAGFIEMAVREVGAERIIFGSHLPSRSLGTELGKIIGADISEEDRRLILGANFRRLLSVE